MAGVVVAVLSARTFVSAHYSVVSSAFVRTQNVSNVTTFGLP